MARTTRPAPLDAQGNCNVCGKPANQPYRRIVAGRITEGCVARGHDGRLVTPSESAYWHRAGVKSLGAARV